MKGKTEVHGKKLIKVEKGIDRLKKQYLSVVFKDLAVVPFHHRIQYVIVKNFLQLKVYPQCKTNFQMRMQLLEQLETEIKESSITVLPSCAVGTTTLSKSIVVPFSFVLSGFSFAPTNSLICT